MDIKNLALDDLLNQQDAKANDITLVKADDTTPQSSAEVAIIGVSARIGGANDLNAFWNMLANGQSGTRDLPPARREAFEEYLHLRGVFHRISEQDYLRESFLDDIDKFDYRFFGMSKQEANLMDPNQRLFLQTGWSALEDAGYGGNSIRGSKTGVFVGYSADFGQDYRHIIHTFAPDAPEIAVAGNVKSIIASRLAYQLDLRGPTMMIDTACSSGLVGVHQAIRSIRNNECDMAIAGAVKVDFLPVMDRDDIGVGTKDIQDTIAADERTKTFDDFSDGTSAAEGVIAFVLKNYDQAIADGDNILAVIAGSAINQDGLSVGITAPNSDAQARLIQDALQDADMEPEQISYIEAHGTATRLGDPIEVAGINRAFSSFTQRKQFCGIGSVKTNIGHMDNGAGLAGLTKVLLAIQHGQLPPSLNFNTPNRNIPFEQSPVYVNDVLRPWKAPDGQPLIAGINSFGLSGTNCHVIVREEPVRIESAPHTDKQDCLFLLSAINTDALKRQAQNFLEHLKGDVGSNQRWQDICFTAAIGRIHHQTRLAIIANSQETAIQALEQFLSNDAVSTNDVYQFNQFKVVPQSTGNSHEITETEQQQLSHQADDFIVSILNAKASEERLNTLTELQASWVRGANPDWSVLFSTESNSGQCRRVSLPTYPFAQESCWVEATVAAEKALNQGASAKTFNHPLLDQCVVKSYGFHLYRVNLSARKHWELADHIVKGVCVLPGTCYIEIMLQVATQLRGAHYHDHPWPLVFERVQFLSPFSIYPKENRDLHIQVQEKDHARYSIRIVSHEDENGKAINAHSRDLGWEVHAEATIHLEQHAPETGVINPADLIPGFPRHLLFSRADDVSKGLEIGDRWNHSFVDGWQKDDMSEFMVKLILPGPFSHESEIYAWHPALLDVAVNAANHALGDGDLFLPFSYKNFTVISKLPDEVFVWFTTKNATDEMYTFDIRLMNNRGEICGRIDEYTIKRVPETASFDQAPANPQLFALRAVDAPEPDLNQESEIRASSAQNDEPILFIHNGQPVQTALSSSLNHQLGHIVDLCLPADTESETSVRQQLQTLKKQDFAAVLYAGTLTDGFSDEGVGQLSESLSLLKSCLNGLVQEKVQINGPCFVLTTQSVTTPLDAISTERKSKYQVEPDQAAITAFARIASMENPQLKLSCVNITRSDLQDETAQWLTSDLSAYDATATNQSQLIWHRDNKRLAEQLDTLNLDGTPENNEQIALTDDGVYVITGGTGALGLELAWYLTQQFQQSGATGHLKLALIGTREIPTESSWSELLNTDHTDTNQESRLRQKLSQLQSIRAAGAELSCHAVNLADQQAVKALTEQLRERHQRIKGVIHAAGRAGAGYLMNKTDAQIHDVVDGKALGAWHLHQQTLSDELQFFVMYSSIATILRNPGQSDYTAANSFLDALAEYRRNQGLPALSVCWPAWRETGIAVQWNAVDEDEFFAPIDTAEALSLLGRAINAGEQLPASVVLANLNTKANLDDIHQLGIIPSPELERHLTQSTASATSAAVADTSDMPDVVLKGVSDPDEIDHLVASAWRKVLGMPEFEYEESINDLGGNSILTTQLYKEFDRLHPGMIEMADLFSLTTIKTQAEQLKKALGYNNPNNPQGTQEHAKESEAADEQNMDDILAKLASGELSAEEAQDLL